MIEGNNKVYIIVVWHEGIPHFLQTNNKVKWFFEALIKPYVRLENAKKTARKLCAEYVNDKVCVYHIEYSAIPSSSDFVHGKFDKDIVFCLKEK